MEPAKWSTKCARNGVLDSSLMCQSSGKLKSNKKDMKYRGVWRRAPDRFIAKIRDPITKQRRWLGTYDTAELAASAYDFAARAMRGTRAKTNFLNVIFDPYKFAPSGPPTLTSDSSHPFLSKSSNLDCPLSNSLLHKPSQKQDHQFSRGSPNKLSSFWDKFGLTNQNIPAPGHPTTTNDFTLPCRVPLSQFFPVSSSPTACTLNMPLQPFLNKTTSAVLQTISTTPCLPNPVFPSSPHSQQCNTVMPLHSFSSNAEDFSYSDSSMMEKITNEFTPRPISTIESSSTTCSFACDINSTLDYSFGFPREPYYPTTPCTIIHSTTDLLNQDLQNGLYVNQNKQQWTEEYDIKKELSSTQLPASCEFFEMPPTADFLLEDIPDAATLSLLDSIWD